MKLFLPLILLYSLALCEMRVYVSNSSPIENITLQELKNLYLKKTKLLEKQKVTVYDNEKDYSKFCKLILNKNDGQMHAYWMKQIFLGKSIPPKKVKFSDITLLLNQDTSAIIYSDKNLDAKAIYVYQ